MKHHQLLILILLPSLIFYACRDELEPSSSRQREGEGFSISQARDYFEKYATDLSFIHINEEEHTKTRNSSSKIELTPNWDKAIHTVGEKVTMIEVPVKANALLLGTCRYFEQGKFIYSTGEISQVRLVVAKRDNGDIDMFVATLVPSGRFYNTQKDMDDFRYLGGQGNFTGKVFCSTLDGHFVEVHQYIGGKYLARAKAIPRANLEEHDIHLEELDYETIRFVRGVLTRSGTYDFDESEDSESSTCSYHPTYEADECPFCLDEVVIIACKNCGKSLDYDEICSCTCTKCLQYPCICCIFCGTYPCHCSTCHSDPCTKCSRCGAHYCYGQCAGYIGGGGGGGSSTTTPTTPTTPDPVVPADTIKDEKHVITDTDILAREDLKDFKRREQIGNTCVPTVMEYIGKMIDEDGYIKRRKIIRYYQENIKTEYNKKHDVKNKGVPNKDVPKGMVYYFSNNITNTAYSSNSIDYKTAIDAGRVVMTNVPITDTMWHNILVIGYTQSGEYIYMDPNDNDNFYKCSEGYLKSNNSLKYSFEIEISTN